MGHLEDSSNDAFYHTTYHMLANRTNELLHRGAFNQSAPFPSTFPLSLAAVVFLGYPRAGSNEGGYSYY